MKVTSIILIVALATMVVPSSASAQKMERTFLRIDWTETARAGTSPHDTTLLIPDLMLLFDNRVIIGDVTNARIVSVDVSDGSLVWTYARRGKGPKELMRPSDLEQGKDGNVLVLDGGNNRIVTIDRDGQPVDEVTLRRHVDFPVVRFARPGNGDDFVFVGATFSSPLILGALRDRLARRVMPFPRDSVVPEGARFQVRAASNREGTWILAHRLGPTFAIGQGTSATPTVHRYIEPIPFSRVSARRRTVGDLMTPESITPMRFSARDVSFACDRVFILFGVTEPDSRQLGTTLVDVYDEKGRYEVSFHIPEPAIAFQTDGTRSVALTREPWPTLTMMTPRRVPDLCDLFSP